jgi:hypothetical protein
MGSIVKAKCACGFEKEFTLGGGYSGTDCNFPIYCVHCNILFEGNVLDKNLICPSCKTKDVLLYDNEQLCKKKGTEEVFDWNMEEEIGKILILTDGKYWCPECKSFCLSFSDEGCWD